MLDPQSGLVPYPSAGAGAWMLAIEALAAAPLFMAGACPCGHGRCHWLAFRLPQCELGSSRVGPGQGLSIAPLTCTARMHSSLRGCGRTRMPNASIS